MPGFSAFILSARCRTAANAVLEDGKRLPSGAWKGYAGAHCLWNAFRAHLAGSGDDHRAGLIRDHHQHRLLARLAPMPTGGDCPALAERTVQMRFDVKRTLDRVLVTKPTTFAGQQTVPQKVRKVSRKVSRSPGNNHSRSHRCLHNIIVFNNLQQVGATGFEPATSWSRTSGHVVFFVLTIWCLLLTSIDYREVNR